MSFTREEIIKSVYELKYKLAPSLIPGAGVGLFALVDIPADTYVVQHRTATDFHIPWEEVKDAPIVVQEHIAEMTTCDWKEFRLDVPADMIYPAYYVNHSAEPNLYWDRHTDELYAIRNIAAGEEMTTYYKPEERTF